MQFIRNSFKFLVFVSLIENMFANYHHRNIFKRDKKEKEKVENPQKIDFKDVSELDVCSYTIGICYIIH